MWFKKLVMVVVTVAQNFVFLPLVRWAGSALLQREQERGQFPTIAPICAGEYVTPAFFLSPLVVIAAFDDDTKLFTEKPEFAQSVLNACLESLRNPKIQQSLFAMFGSLVASGLGPEEALLRCNANSLMLGMAVQRRLDRPDFAASVVDGRDSSNSQSAA